MVDRDDVERLRSQAEYALVVDNLGPALHATEKVGPMVLDGENFGR